MDHDLELMTQYIVFSMLYKVTVQKIFGVKLGFEGELGSRKDRF